MSEQESESRADFALDTICHVSRYLYQTGRWGSDVFNILKEALRKIEQERRGVEEER